MKNVMMIMLALNIFALPVIYYETHDISILLYLNCFIVGVVLFVVGFDFDIYDDLGDD